MWWLDPMDCKSITSVFLLIIWETYNIALIMILVCIPISTRLLVATCDNVPRPGPATGDWSRGHVVTWLRWQFRDTYRLVLSRLSDTLSWHQSVSSSVAAQFLFSTFILVLKILGGNFLVSVCSLSPFLAWTGRDNDGGLLCDRDKSSALLLF